MSAAKDGSSTTPSPPVNNEILLGQRLSGMRRANSLSEWQLQAVLFKAKLTQYFDIFISQGGDDIDQIMQCEEHEFLEIMSLVGMASKPLHVRRLQRTLNEFSLNRAQFLMNSVPFIGFPPVDLSNASSSSNENLTAALQFLIPGFGQTESQAFSAAEFSSAPAVSTMSKVDSMGNLSSTSSIMPSLASLTSGASTIGMEHTTVSATANVLPFPDSVLMSLVGVSGAGVSSSSSSSSTAAGIASLIATTAAAAAAAAAVSTADSLSVNIITPSTSSALPIFPSFRDKTQTISPVNDKPLVTGSSSSEICHFAQIPSTSSGVDRVASSDGIVQQNIYGYTTNHLFEIPHLMQEEVTRLAQFAQALSENMPSIEPRFVQNKKKISRELLDVMSIPPTHPKRIVEFRRFSAIYGRFDAKRKPDKALTFHEALVNEAAAQLCVCRPELLTRRDELFPMARKLVRLAGFFGPRSTFRQRHHSEDSADNADDSETAGKSGGEERSRTTSRSSIATDSASPSPTPSAKIRIASCYHTSRSSDVATPQPSDATGQIQSNNDRHDDGIEACSDVADVSRHNSQSPDVSAKIGKKRKRASPDA